MTPLFDAQRRTCLACGGKLTRATLGRPRRYCDADCAKEGKRESDRRHMTPARLGAMREAKSRQKTRNAQQGTQQPRSATNTTQPEATHD